MQGIPALVLPAWPQAGAIIEDSGKTLTTQRAMSRQQRPELLQIELELSERQWADLLTDRPWGPLPADLEEVVQLLPDQAERCTRTDVLVWCHRHQGLISFPQIWQRLTGYEDNRAARKHTISILGLMVRQGLLTKTHFAADAPDKPPTGMNEGSAFELTGPGLLYLRGAVLARQKLWRWMSITQAHQQIGEEEDDGRNHELHYLNAVSVRDSSGNLVKQSTTGLLNSVFALGG